MKRPEWCKRLTFTGTTEGASASAEVAPIGASAVVEVAPIGTPAATGVGWWWTGMFG